MCRLVVVVVGDSKATSGLRWEINKLVDLKMLHKVIFVLPPLPEKRIKGRWDILIQLLGDRIPAYQGGEIALSFARDGVAVVHRGERRWERDYLHHLSPLVPKYDQPPKTTWRSIFSGGVSHFFPLQYNDTMSRQIRFCWIVLIPMLETVIYAILMEHRYPSLAVAWAVLAVPLFGWFVASMGNLHHTLDFS